MDKLRGIKMDEINVIDVDFSEIEKRVFSEYIADKVSLLRTGIK